MTTTMTRLDRWLLQVAPQRALARVRARALAETLLTRHYEGGQRGYRSDHWQRSASDANAANATALHTLRNVAHDLVRNNPWARRGKQIVSNHAVGWGIQATPVRAGRRARKQAAEAWRRWFESKQCDVAGQLNGYGLQRLAIDTVVESGEVLVRRYYTPGRRDLALPLQLQILEPDYLDTSRDGMRTTAGHQILQGVEFDPRGRRVAYYLFPEHPGSSHHLTSRTLSASQRVPASDVVHLYSIDRPGQVRGPSWYAPVIVKFKDYDEYEDALLFKQKIAACLTAFVTDADGAGVVMGPRVAGSAITTETLSPGMIIDLPVGKDVTMVSPPAVPDGAFDTRILRAAAVGLGVTYEDLTGDYSGVNFSSARMARLSHWANVYDWQWNMIVPRLCDPIWGWAMEAAEIAGVIAERPEATWTPAPMPVIEPDREARADILRVRSGQATFSQVLRERGIDPETHWHEYAADMARLDADAIVLDSDARRTTQAGNPIPVAAGGEGGAAGGAAAG